jgi:hypothetical protein
MGETMDHTAAVNSHAVERYLLREMPESEIESFERHFFECTDCTADLESGALLAENMRAALADRPAPERTKWAWLKELWHRPVFAAPAFATVILAGVVVYQATELAEVNKPRAAIEYPVKSASRGELDKVVVPAGSKTFSLIPQDLPEVSEHSLRCDLDDAGSHLRFSAPCPAPSDGGVLKVEFPVRGLQSGTYVLRVLGLRDSQPPVEIMSYPFVLQLK